MTEPLFIPGVEGDAALPQPTLPTRPRAIRPGLRITVRGRSVHLRRLHRPPSGVLRWLALLGLGIIAGAAGNDAGGIATYSQTGAQFGYDLLWLIVLITVSLAVVQEMSARLGAATGRGLLDLIRERFDIVWALFALGVVLIANLGLTISEFVGIGAAAELLGLSKYFAIPLAAALVWFLIVVGSYSQTEKIFLVLTLVFFAYPVAAILSHPHWNEVARGMVTPTIHADPDYLLVFVGLIGTTMTPYQQLFQQSSIVEKGVARRHYGPERIDTYVGMILSNLMSAFIIIATAATLHVAGKNTVDSAAEAAQALRPVAGAWAAALFATGLLGASLLAAGVLPLATAYSISEAFGFPKGVNQAFHRARSFFGIFTGLIVGGAGVALIPNVPVIQLLLAIQVLNGMLLPVILIFLLLLINDRRLVGELANTRLYNVLGWGTFMIVSTAVAILLGTQTLSAVGINVWGS